MRKLYFLAAMAAALLGTSQAQALTLDDIIGTYSSDGFVWDDYGTSSDPVFPDFGKDNGWTVFEGSASIERIGETADSVLFKGFLPEGKDLVAVFNEA